MLDESPLNLTWWRKPCGNSSDDSARAGRQPTTLEPGRGSRPKSADSPKSVKQFSLQPRSDAATLLQRHSQRNKKSDEIDEKSKKISNREHFEENARKLKEAEKQKKAQGAARTAVLSPRRVSFSSTIKEKKITSSDDDDAFVAASDTPGLKHSASTPLLVTKELIDKLYKEEKLVSKVKLVKDITVTTSVSSAHESGDETEGDRNDSTTGTQGSTDELMNVQQPAANLAGAPGAQHQENQAAANAAVSDSDSEESVNPEPEPESEDENAIADGEDEEDDQPDAIDDDLPAAGAQAIQLADGVPADAGQIQLPPVDVQANQPGADAPADDGQLQLQQVIAPAGNGQADAGQVQLPPAGNQPAAQQQPIFNQGGQVANEGQIQLLPVVNQDNLIDLNDQPAGLHIPYIVIDDQPIDIQAAEAEIEEEEEYFDAVDNEAEMAPTTPELFSGLMSDDADSWIRYTERWLSTQRSPDEASKIKRVALYLTGRALLWFDGLTIAEGPPALPAGDGAPGNQAGAQQPDNAINTFQQFRQAFLEKFRRNQEDLQREAQEVWEFKQEGRTTEEFVTAILEKGRRAHIEMPNLMFAIKNGLRPDIQAAVMAAPNIMTVDDIVKQGRISERYPPVATIPKELTEMMKRMGDALDQAQLRPMVAGSATDERPPRPNTPRIQFEEAQQTEQPPRSYQRSYQNTGEWAPRGNARGGPSRGRGGFGRGRGGGGRGGPGFRQGQTYYGYQAQDQGTTGFTPNQIPGESRPGPQPINPGTYYPSYQQGGATNCDKCGRNSHWGGICPAMGKICGNCGKLNHFMRVCRSTQGFPSQN